MKRFGGDDLPPLQPGSDNIIPMLRGKPWLEDLNETVQQQPVREREEDYDYRVSEPLRPNTWTCKTCKMPVDGKTVYGWLRDRETSKLSPCPTCYPPFVQAKSRRESEELIDFLIMKRQFTNQQNMPAGGESLTFAQYPDRADQRAKEIVQQIVEGKLKRCFIYGDVGLGKTGLEISAVHALTTQGKHALFLPVLTYLNLLRVDEYKQAIKDIVRLVEYLFVDELGVENPTRATLRDIQELVEVRHNQPGTKTMITSNMSLDQLERYWHLPELGEIFQPAKRTISRLRGYYTCVEITGEDLRQMDEED